MKNSKKLLVLMLAFVMVITLAACGGNQGATSSSEAPAASSEAPAESSEAPAESSEAPAESSEAPAAEGGQTYKIGVAIYQYNDNFMTLYRQELEKYFQELGAQDGNTYEVEFQDGKNDQATQTEQLNNFIAQGKNLIIANLVDPTGADQIINSAKSANIPVVLINREPAMETLKIWEGETTYVGVDARQSGVYQGEMIAGLDDKGDLNGDGKVSYIMIMGDAGNVDAEQRTQYSVETLQKSIEVEKLTEQRGNWDTAKGQEITSNALSQFGDKLEVVFSNNDGMALGAKQAIDGAGRKVNEDIYLVGVDALPDVVELLGKGEFTGTVLNDHFNQSHTAAEIAVRLLQGETVAPYYWHDYIKVLKPEDAELKRLDYREETFEQYQQRLTDEYGI